MFAWLKPKTSTMEQLLDQRAARIQAHETAKQAEAEAESLALDDPAKHSKTLAKAQDDTLAASRDADLARKLPFHRLTTLSSEAVQRLQAERDRLLGPASAEVNRRLEAAQHKVDDLAAQLKVATAARDGVQSELWGLQQSARELDERVTRLHRDRDEALGLDLDDDEQGYQRRRLMLAAQRFEETQP